MAHRAIIIGGGPAGLMAAETLALAGIGVTIYDRKPSVGRKFLMAGRGGLNLTHSEPLEKFIGRYGDAQDFLSPHLNSFTPHQLREWAEDLGQETFIGSSGRVFPKALKASPLLRSWLQRLESLGVAFKLRQQWLGFDEKANLIFQSENGDTQAIHADAALLTLGGASWPNLGSDGGWFDILKSRGIKMAELRPANCGFKIVWSEHFKTRFAGTPLKTVSLNFTGHIACGDIMITDKGIEGGPVYALSSFIREALNKNPQSVTIDLKPGLTLEQIVQKINKPHRRQSFSTFFGKALNLSLVALNLLREMDKEIANYPNEKLAYTIKNLPLEVLAPFSLERAISTAGGLKLDELDANFMLKKMPGIFAAGEMLDWEAPTGGYLLQACFASGRAAGLGMMDYLNRL